MAGISSRSADTEPMGHGGEDDDDDAAPLLDLLQKLPELCVERELHDLSATAGTAADAAEPPEAGAYTRPPVSST